MASPVLEGHDAKGMEQLRQDAVLVHPVAFAELRLPPFRKLDDQMLANMEHVFALPIFHDIVINLLKSDDGTRR